MIEDLLSLSCRALLAYLFVSPVVVLNDDCGLGLSVLLVVSLFPALVGPVGLLDDLCGLVELALLLIGQGQPAQGLFAFHRCLEVDKLIQSWNSSMSLGFIVGAALE